MLGEPSKLRVVNNGDPGMAHGRMGWLEEDPTKFYSGAASRNAADIGEVSATSGAATVSKATQM